MKQLILLALLALPVCAQEKPDVVTLSKQVVDANAKACSELLEAFKRGDLLIKELRAENAEQKTLIELQAQQLAIVRQANTKLEAANESLRLANESLKKALDLAEQQHQKDLAAITDAERRKKKKRLLVTVLKLGAIGGATVGCGPYCGLATAAGLEVLPHVLRK